jgi:hypothetical protein
VHSQKASSPIVVTPVGRPSNDAKPVHPLKASPPILATPVGKPSNDVKPVHPLKAFSPISVTPSATVNPVILVSPSNDVFPSYTTIFSSITDPQISVSLPACRKPKETEGAGRISGKDMDWLDIECMK